jgi:hypothetical protein
MEDSWEGQECRYEFRESEILAEEVVAACKKRHEIMLQQYVNSSMALDVTFCPYVATFFAGTVGVDRKDGLFYRYSKEKYSYLLLFSDSEHIVRPDEQGLPEELMQKYDEIFSESQRFINQKASTIPCSTEFPNRPLGLLKKVYHLNNEIVPDILRLKLQSIGDLHEYIPMKLDLSTASDEIMLRAVELFLFPDPRFDRLLFKLLRKNGSPPIYQIATHRRRKGYMIGQDDYKKWWHTGFNENDFFAPDSPNDK